MIEGKIINDLEKELGMNKKKRYCKHPNCGKPIWHKGNPDFTTGNYCEEHRTPNYKDERKRIADAERQRKKRKGFEKAKGFEATEDGWRKTIKSPEHETRVGTTNLGASTRKKTESGQRVLDAEAEAKVIKKEKKRVFAGKTAGAYATGFTAKEDRFTIPYIPTERDRLLGTDKSIG